MVKKSSLIVKGFNRDGSNTTRISGKDCAERMQCAAALAGPIEFHVSSAHALQAESLVMHCDQACARSHQRCRSSMQECAQCIRLSSISLHSYTPLPSSSCWVHSKRYYLKSSLIHSDYLSKMVALFALALFFVLPLHILASPIRFDVVKR